MQYTLRLRANALDEESAAGVILLGPRAVLIWLFIATVDVIPVAMLATILKGMRAPIIELLLLTVITFASVVGVMPLAERLEG